MQEVVSHQIAFPLQQTTLQPAIPSNTRLSKITGIDRFFWSLILPDNSSSVWRPRDRCSDGLGTLSLDVSHIPQTACGQVGGRALDSLPVVVLTGYTWVTLHYAYSLGERFGYVQKISNKGWLCNTWEGELAMTTVPGTAPQIFQFSVRGDAAAQRIEQRRYCIPYFTLTKYVGTEEKISFTIAELDRYLERRRERDLMSHSDGACLALPPQIREVLSEKRIRS